MIDYTELKRLAETAKDSWLAGCWHNYITLGDEERLDVVDCDFIAAAAPDVVLSMIAEIDRLRLHIEHIDKTYHGAQQLRERIAGEIRPLMQKTDVANTDDIANRIHYPGCWDTAAYPTLVDALWERVEWKGCSTCGASK